MQNVRRCMGALGRGPFSTNVLSSRNFRQNAVLCDMFNVQDTDDFKKRVLDSSTPVLVDFHADWCGPCKMLGPRLESAVAEKEGKVHLAKVDIDENTDLAMEYNVTAVPAVVAIKDGQIVDRFIGLQEEDKIKGFVDKIIGSGKKPQ